MNVFGRVLLALSTVTISLLALGQSTTPSAHKVIVTEAGAVQGVVSNGVLEFKGIPYAAPPIGELRWKMPQAAKAWSGTLDASKYSSACPQLSRYGLTEASYNEDCLYLNVTVPYPGKLEAERQR